jgi:hypothetical protein
MRAGKAELLSAHTVSRGSSSHAKWFLLNASPDLRMQIVGAAELDSRGYLRDLKAVSERGVRHSSLWVWSSPTAISIRCSGFCICGSSSQFTST